MKKYMPDERRQITRRTEIHSQHVGTRKTYITIGFYDDGAPGEIEVRAEKVGTTAAGVLAAWSTAASMLIQYGHIAEVIDKFNGWGCEPSGQTNDPEIHFVSGPIDLTIKYLKKALEKGAP